MVPGWILVKVAACGVCHTDLHAINGDWPVKATLPLIPGHEGGGKSRMMTLNKPQRSVGGTVSVILDLSSNAGVYKLYSRMSEIGRAHV